MLQKTTFFQGFNNFNKFSSYWHDDNGPWRILHKINPVRLQYLKKMIINQFAIPPGPKALKGLKILDVGCGGGLICEPLCRMGAQVEGCDPLEANIEVARNHAKSQSLSIVYHPCALENIPNNPGSFDVLVAFEVIEHVSDWRFFLKKVYELLRPGGIFVLSTLNRTTLSYILGIIAAEYVLRWVPAGTHNWRQFIKPEELTWVLNHTGFENISFQGLLFSPWTMEFYLGKSENVNYFTTATKPMT